MYYLLLHFRADVGRARQETTQPYLLLARQALPQSRSAAYINEICSQALSDTYRRDGRQGTAICLWQAAPRAHPHRRMVPPGCPSAPRGHLPVTWRSPPAAAAPWTPACTGAPSNLRGRGGKPGGIWWGWWASSSWVRPCWRSEGCRRGRVAPRGSYFRPREWVTNSREGKASMYMDFAPCPWPCYCTLEHFKKYYAIWR